jgi:UDP:flavonoid glycosyltransferase YjiC (YdhE family)
MHVILTSTGSDGDVFPYIGLGAELRRLGHQATLAASAHYQPLAQQHGLAFQALVSAGENRELFGHPDFWNPLKTAFLAARWGMRFLERQYRLLSSLNAPGTVLVASLGVLAASLAHEKSGTPLALCFDQEDNGHRVRQLGVGDWLKFGPGGGRRMADALHRLLSAETQDRCHAVSARFTNPDGLARAAQFLERWREEL